MSADIVIFAYNNQDIGGNLYCRFFRSLQFYIFGWGECVTTVINAFTLYIFTRIFIYNAAIVIRAEFDWC